ncbi:RND family transporter [Mycolicibacterium fluoranthenivorans]|uniref:MMPL/RND family transporter n=1 Tax=Mycolicibacterium fluoranthenivorans TaxID=258505 RepID=UPI000B85460E|nr:RND family transporter [Mycolicibacterium fluoranthenivorans]
MWNAIAAFCSKHAALVIVFWVLLAGASNLLVPQIESVARAHGRGFLPSDAAVNLAGREMADQFHDGASNNLAYLVLEGDHPLGSAERAFHDELVAKLRADVNYVDSVLDLWPDPLTASAVVSTDGKAVYTMVRLRGELGDGAAVHAVQAVREMVLSPRPPPGVQVYLTGPGATIADQITSVDHQMLMITGLTTVLIATLLFLVYRSPVTPAVPLLTVGVALAVARPLVALLGAHDVIEVSIFSAALLAALVLGSATDYGIFLLGRYHEQLRAGAAHDEALRVANRTISPVIAASGLTVAAALSCLAFAHVGLLRSAGLPCAVGVFTGMVASLTFLPALLQIVGKRDLARPRTTHNRSARRWRAIGTIIARWPGPVLVISGLVLLMCAVPAATLRLGFDELDTLPQNTHVNRGYQAMDRHFPPNRLLPEIVLIKSAHNLRDPAGLIAVERVSKQIMAIPGIYMVQSASRPAGTMPEQAALTSQAGVIADQLDANAAQLNGRLASIDKFSSTLEQFSASVAQLQRGMTVGVGGIDQLHDSVDIMRTGLDQLRGNASQMAAEIDPLRNFTQSNPNCAGDGICSLVLKVVEPVDATVAATGSMTHGMSSIDTSVRSMRSGFSGAESSLTTMRAALHQMNALVADVKGVSGQIQPMISTLVEYLRGMREDFQGSGEGGFYLPERAWHDPAFQRASEVYFAPDGKATRILVFGNGKMFGPDGAQRSADIVAALKAATKEGTLAGSTLINTGFGTGIGELHAYVVEDFSLLAKVSLALVFLIVLVMLRSPVAAVVVFGTVVVSYVSAIGISTLIWQDLVGKDLHWPVTSIALIALVAVGSDYNLLMTMRMREEVSRHGAGLRTGIIRAFGGTGGVVTVAGIVFGITMLAMMVGDVLSIQQVGATIGVGLLIDTLIVRAFLVPALASALGQWFWWSPAPFARALRSRWSTTWRARPHGTSTIPADGGVAETVAVT